MPSRRSASARGPSSGLASAWVETAPVPASVQGQIAPTAKKRLATATARKPVSGSRATIDQVMPSP